MASILGGIGGLLGQVRAAATTVAEAVEAKVPEQLKPQVSNLAHSVDAFVSNAKVLNQLGIPTPATLPKLATQAQVKAAYVTGAKRDLTDPATLKQLNQELKARDPNAKPLTAAEVNSVIDKTDVRSLTPAQYATLKAATGGSRDNPATTLDAENRAKVQESGPENLARSRIRSTGSNAEPTAEQIATAKEDLRAIDPGIFSTPPKDVVYVNQKHLEGNGDPRQTKVASHEFLHAVLDHRGVPEKDADGTDPQHAIIGRLGWNQKFGTSGKVIPGETANWATGPGAGLPPK